MTQESPTVRITSPPGLLQESLGFLRFVRPTCGTTVVEDRVEFLCFELSGLLHRLQDPQTVLQSLRGQPHFHQFQRIHEFIDLETRETEGRCPSDPVLGTVGRSFLLQELGVFEEFAQPEIPGRPEFLCHSVHVLTILLMLLMGMMMMMTMMTLERSMITTQNNQARARGIDRFEDHGSHEIAELRGFHPSSRHLSSRSRWSVIGEEVTEFLHRHAESHGTVAGVHRRRSSDLLQRKQRCP